MFANRLLGICKEVINLIWLYTGTPGSGKSLDAARDILRAVNISKKTVIANFPVNEKYFRKGHGQFIYKDNSELTVEFLIKYSIQNNKMGKEGQTLLVIDEAQCIFNSRDTLYAKDRMLWIKFFSQHRKFGYNIILIAQFDRMLDRQIRSLVEYEVIHRKVNNFKIGFLVPFPLFVKVETWYGMKEKTSSQFYLYRKKLNGLYDSYKAFDNEFLKEVKKYGIIKGNDDKDKPEPAA